MPVRALADVHFVYMYICIYTYYVYPPSMLWVPMLLVGLFSGGRPADNQELVLAFFFYDDRNAPSDALRHRDQLTVDQGMRDKFRSV